MASFATDHKPGDAKSTLEICGSGRPGTLVRPISFRLPLPRLLSFAGPPRIEASTQRVPQFSRGLSKISSRPALFMDPKKSKFPPFSIRSPPVNVLQTAGPSAATRTLGHQRRACGAHGTQGQYVDLPAQYANADQESQNSKLDIGR